ncbi:hypothetical protein [Pedobacter alluvionis]|uniref:Lipoprotein n=1 Tax=Pedobacter alluvionis TaxID=475253 RepID=A0A497Y3Z1_9SPHI|nr:hypothetical protein [Pedobacter alluvionis]RLJ75177.1 hypothetical protein BCL90_3528 [Pedobacter alluvionis]TFB30279.1 hypothetical protein E3V97_19110 [Pedobacter alluvionis]
MPKTISFTCESFKNCEPTSLWSSNHWLFHLLSGMLCLLIVSCSGDPKQSSKAVAQKGSRPEQVIQNPKPQILRVSGNKAIRDTAIEVLDQKEIRFNGRLKRFFSFSEFRSVLGEPDSTKLLSEEEPCTNIFQEADGSIDPEAQYLYKNGSRFECSRGKVAIDEIKFSYGDFIVFHNITLNKHTTLVELTRLFPNATEHIGTMHVAGEGVLQVIQLREDKGNISDGHVNIFIKNGKLYSLHWWFPC